MSSIYQGPLKSFDINAQAFPQEAKDIYQGVLAQVQWNLLILNKLFPNRFEFEDVFLYVDSRDTSDYLDNGNTPSPGHQVTFRWQSAVDGNPSNMDGWMSEQHGVGTKSVWHKLEVPWRICDSRIKRSLVYTAFIVGLWRDYRNIKCNEERIKHGFHDDLRLDHELLADTVVLIQQIIERNRLTKAIQQTVHTYPFVVSENGILRVQ